MLEQNYFMWKVKYGVFIAVPYCQAPRQSVKHAVIERGRRDRVNLGMTAYISRRQSHLGDIPGFSPGGSHKK